MNTVTNTRDQILDLAQMLIQTRGYNGFSYQDIATALNIKKPSIHYHFQNKADLGKAVVDRYSSRFEQALENALLEENKSTLELFNFYIQPYLEYSKTADLICLCGALAGETIAIPDPMRIAIDAFFAAHQNWIKKILDRGVKREELNLTTSTTKTARLIFSSLQGALLVKRATGEISQMNDVVSTLKAQLFRHQ